MGIKLKRIKSHRLGCQEKEPLVVNYFAVHPCGSSLRLIDSVEGYVRSGWAELHHQTATLKSATLTIFRQNDQQMRVNGLGWLEFISVLPSSFA